MRSPFSFGGKARVLNVFVPVSAVFPGVQADIQTFVSLLRTLSRGDVVMRAARLIHNATSAPEEKADADNAFGVADCFDVAETHRILCFAREHGCTAPFPFFRGSLLELIRWAVLVCEDHPDDGVSFESPDARQTFAKVALIANEVWGQHVFDGWADMDVERDLARARYQAIPALRRSAESASSVPLLSHRLGRGWTLFTNLLPTQNGDFLDSFHAATGLTVSDYYACYCAIISEFILNKSAAVIFDSNTLGRQTSNPALVYKFIQIESQTLDELRDALWGNLGVRDQMDPLPKSWDLKPIRERPIVRLTDGRAIILDPVAVYDKLSIGPLFHTLKAVSDQKVTHQLFADFGKVFERYIQQILRRSFPEPGNGLIDQLTCNLEGRSLEGAHELDACIDYGPDLVVIETKAKWSREAELVPSAWQSLLQSLRKQYGGEGSESGAALQFARFCRAIAKSGRVEPHWDFRHIRRIIPVLVVHDPLLASSGLGPLLRAEFIRAVGPCVKVHSGEIEIGNIRVLMPIVLTVDDIENLEASIEHFSLRAVLADYALEDPVRLKSFHNFIAASPTYSSKLYVNRNLAGAALEGIGCALRTLFKPTSNYEERLARHK